MGDDQGPARCREPGATFGVDYSLCLFNPADERLVSYDNAHRVLKGRGPSRQRSKTRDHVHRGKAIKPYDYRNAEALLVDFWGGCLPGSRGGRRAVRRAGSRVLRIGIASRDQMRARTLAIARGERRRRPGEPSVWFTSLESLAQVLSGKNRLLLELIRRTKPASMKELARASGRKESNLSRTLHTMERYGLVRLSKLARGRLVPEVPYDRLTLDVAIAADAAVAGGTTRARRAGTA